MEHQNYLWKITMTQRKKMYRVHTLAEWNVACVLTNMGIDFEEILIDRESSSVLRHHFFHCTGDGKREAHQNYTQKYSLIWIYVNKYWFCWHSGCSAAVIFPQCGYILMAPPRITISWQVSFATVSGRSLNPLLICWVCQIDPGTSMHHGAPRTTLPWVLFEKILGNQNLPGLGSVLHLWLHFCRLTEHML